MGLDYTGLVAQIDGDVLIPIVALVMVFGIPLSAILSGHFRKMAELRMKMSQQADERVTAALQQLKGDMQELRDTTTKYDISFDAALQRIESRVGNLESRVTNLEQTNSVTPLSRM